MLKVGGADEEEEDVVGVVVLLDWDDLFAVLSFDPPPSREGFRFAFVGEAGVPSETLILS